MLAGIVEDRGVLAIGALDDLFERLALEFRALDGVVAVVDISEMVLVVVVLQRLLRHEGLERVMSIGKIRKSKGHQASPWAVKWLESEWLAIRRRGHDNPAAPPG